MDTEKGSSGLSVGTRDGVTSSTHALGGESDAKKVAPRQTRDETGLTKSCPG